MNGFTHIDDNGNASMVDVSQKNETERFALASGIISVSREVMDAIQNDAVPKGNVLATARIAGIMAAKKTFEIIPMCHPLPLEKIAVDIEPINDTQVKIISTVSCTYKTGVEMEALTAANVAALTIYDMCKAVDRGMEISECCLLYKDGGKSGVYEK